MRPRSSDGKASGPPSRLSETSCSCWRMLQSCLFNQRHSWGWKWYKVTYISSNIRTLCFAMLCCSLVQVNVTDILQGYITDDCPNVSDTYCQISNISRTFNQSINQSNPVLLKERVRIPRTRRAGGAAMLWRRLPLDGVGSCRLFFTDDLHDNLSWVPASDKPHTFKSCFTHSSQVFFGRPGPFLPGTGLDLTLFISPLERMTCPNHLSRRSRTRMARSHIPSLACSSSIDGSSDGLTCLTLVGTPSTTNRQISIISRTLVGNKIVDHSDVVGASPVGAAPTTSSFST